MSIWLVSWDKGSSGHGVPVLGPLSFRSSWPIFSKVPGLVGWAQAHGRHPAPQAPPGDTCWALLPDTTTMEVTG